MKSIFVWTLQDVFAIVFFSVIVLFGVIYGGLSFYYWFKNKIKEWWKKLTPIEKVRR
jgi:hypothetical protein